MAQSDDMNKNTDSGNFKFSPLSKADVDKISSIPLPTDEEVEDSKTKEKEDGKFEISWKKLATLACVLVGFGTMAGCGNQETTSQSQQQEGQKDNVEQSDLTQEQLKEMLEIPTGLSTDELSDKILEDLTIWMNYGYYTDYQKSDAGLRQEWYDYCSDNGISSPNENDVQAFADKKAEENSVVFIEILFKDGYQQSENLKSVIEKYKSINAGVIKNVIATQWNYEDSVVNVYTWYKADSATETSQSGERDLSINLYQYVNTDKDYSTAEETSIYTLTITVQEDDSLEKISFAHIQ